MADTKPEEEKAPEGDAAKKPAAAQGIMPLLISSVVMAVILGGVGFALAYFVLPSRMQSTAPATAATTPATAGAATNAPAANAAVPVVKEATARSAAGVYFDAPPAVLEELEANRARMVDTLGQVLSTKTLDDLTSPDIRGNLRQELLGIINPTLKQGRVDNIYFTDLLVQ